MKYEDIRHEIKSLDVLGYSESGPWNSWRNIQLNLVKMGTMSEYNHVGLAYVIGGRVFVIEAVVPYIRIYPLSRELPFFWIPTPYKLDDSAEEKLLEKVGLPYSKWEAIKALFTTETDSDKVWECAKLVNKVLVQYDKNFELLHDTPSDTIRYLTQELEFPITYVE